MRKVLWMSAIGALLLASGCGAYAPPVYTAYGKSGARFSAPDLCAALVACLKSGDIPCAQESITLSGPNGQQVDACRLIGK